MDKKTEKRTNREAKRRQFFRLLSLRDDLSDDGSDLEKLKELGGFNDN